MADFPTAEVRAIGAMELTADGEFLLIHGAQPTVALHHSTFHPLLVALPNAIEHAQQIIGRNDGARFALHSAGWEIGRIDGTPNVIIRFHLEGGACLGFSVPGEQVPPMLEALCASAGMMLTAAPVAGRTLQ